MNLVVVGQGYVGLPLAMRAVEAGHQVVGYELDEERVRRLNSGDSYIEDIPSTQLRAALDSGRYNAASDEGSLAEFDIAVITVPTPLRDGIPDLSFIESASATLARHLRPGAAVVLESTTYPGTTEELAAPILEAGSGLVAGRDFHLGYSPERIDPGNPTWTFVNTPKVVSGIDEASLAVIKGFYDSVIDQTVPVSNCRIAELTKLLENTFRHVNIALVNELAMYAAELDIDVWEAVNAASSKPFGFMPFYPGPGVGGHCLPVDPSYLSWRVERSLGRQFRFVELANDVNQHMPDYVVQRALLAMNEAGRSLKDARVLVLGLAYKRNTGDARESPATPILEKLVGLGAVVRAIDPHVDARYVDPQVKLVEDTDEEIANSDLVILVTDHDVFDLDRIAGLAPLVLDTRHRFAPAPNVEHL
jgi:UDP-N-acetyl-D-glucosamine dehydrogenase